MSGQARTHAHLPPSNIKEEIHIFFHYTAFVFINISGPDLLKAR
jgi:hypothetical protein